MTPLRRSPTSDDDDGCAAIQDREEYHSLQRLSEPEEEELAPEVE